MPAWCLPCLPPWALPIGSSPLPGPKGLILVPSYPQLWFRAETQAYPVPQSRNIPWAGAHASQWPSRYHRPSHGRLQLCFRAVSSTHSLFLAPIDLTPAGNRKAWEWDPEKVASGPECDTLPPRHWYLCCEHQLPYVQHLPLGLNLPQKGSFCLLLGSQLCVSRPVFSWLALLQSENHQSRSFTPDQEVNNSLCCFAA